jgi:hypothetical protein
MYDCINQSQYAANILRVSTIYLNKHTMVRKGNFMVEVVYADSTDPFKEHLDAINGKTYAEVEPDIDYFIRVTNHGARKVIMGYTVDGQDLGCSSLLSGNGRSTVVGLLHRENGRSHKTALRFNKLYRAKRNKAPDGDYEGNWTGCIEVDVHEYIPRPGYKTKTDFSSNWTSNSEQILAGLDLSSNKKACNSTKGKVKSDYKQAHFRQNYKKGSKLATLQLYYCSTVGLFAAGILEKPSMPDVSQIRSSIYDAAAGDADNENNCLKRRRFTDDVKVKICRVIKKETLQQEVLDLTNDE